MELPSGTVDAWRSELDELVGLAFEAYTTKEPGADWAPMAVTRTPTGDIGLTAAAIEDGDATDNLLARLRQAAADSKLRAVAIVTELGLPTGGKRSSGVLVIADHELAPHAFGYMRPATPTGDTALGAVEDVNADSWAIFPRG